MPRQKGMVALLGSIRALVQETVAVPKGMKGQAELAVMALSRKLMSSLDDEEKQAFVSTGQAPG
eukprot:9559625-Prorocentrum_lima.AAC.1